MYFSSSHKIFKSLHNVAGLQDKYTMVSILLFLIDCNVNVSTPFLAGSKTAQSIFCSFNIFGILSSHPPQIDSTFLILLILHNSTHALLADSSISIAYIFLFCFEINADNKPAPLYASITQS